jgi:hypothetical protein
VAEDVEVTVRIKPVGLRRTPAHPTLEPDGPDLAITTELGEPGEVLAHIAYRTPSVVAWQYRRVREAMAVLVDLPDLGVCASECLVEHEMHRVDGGSNWVGAKAGTPALAGTEGGCVSAAISVDGPTDRPLSLIIRAAFRDQLSTPSRIEVPIPAPAEDE